MSPLNQLTTVATNPDTNNFDIVDALPNEIRFHVMSFLPTLTVGLTQRVNRSWHQFNSSAFEKAFNNFILSKDLLLRCKQDIQSWDFDGSPETVYEMAQLEALIDLAAAKDTAASISMPYYNAIALVEIVRVEALTNLAAAKNTAASIKYPFHKAEAFLEIVKIEALTNLADAKDTAESIQDSDRKAEAFLEIVQVEALTNLAAAKNTAASIQEPYYNAIALREILKAEVLIDSDAANITVETIQDPRDKIMARLAMAKVLLRS